MGFSLDPKSELSARCYVLSRGTSTSLRGSHVRLSLWEQALLCTCLLLFIDILFDIILIPSPRSSSGTSGHRGLGIWKTLPWQGLRRCHPMISASESSYDCIIALFEHHEYKCLSRGGRLKEYIPEGGSDLYCVACNFNSLNSLSI